MNHGSCHVAADGKLAIGEGAGRLRCLEVIHRITVYHGNQQSVLHGNRLVGGVVVEADRTRIFLAIHGRRRAVAGVVNLRPLCSRSDGQQVVGYVEGRNLADVWTEDGYIRSVEVLGKGDSLHGHVLRHLDRFGIDRRRLRRFLVLANLIVDNRTCGAARNHQFIIYDTHHRSCCLHVADYEGSRGRSDMSVHRRQCLDGSIVLDINCLVILLALGGRLRSVCGVVDAGTRCGGRKLQLVAGALEGWHGTDQVIHIQLISGNRRVVVIVAQGYRLHGAVLHQLHRTGVEIALAGRLCAVQRIVNLGIGGRGGDADVQIAVADGWRCHGIAVYLIGGDIGVGTVLADGYRLDGGVVVELECLLVESALGIRLCSVEGIVYFGIGIGAGDAQHLVLVVDDRRRHRILLVREAQTGIAAQVVNHGVVGARIEIGGLALLGICFAEALHLGSVLVVEGYPARLGRYQIVGVRLVDGELHGMEVAPAYLVETDAAVWLQLHRLPVDVVGNHGILV